MRASAINNKQQQQQHQQEWQLFFMHRYMYSGIYNVNIVYGTAQTNQRTHLTSRRQARQ